MATKKLLFPKQFLWGVATSAHQVEGGNHNNWTVWELENAKSLAKAATYKLDHLPLWPEIQHLAANPHNYVSGRAVDHYHRYESDFDIVKKMNLNAFRFSIEWSRIEPDEGVWNAAEIEHYRQYIAALKKRGIEPCVTLYHWTEPVWFSEKGGFSKTRNVAYFVRFAEKILDELGIELRYITTINEPDTLSLMGFWLQEHPPATHSLIKMLFVYRNLLKAHKLVYKLAKRKSRRFKVGFTKSYIYAYPADDRFLSKWSAKFDYLLRDDLVLWYVGKKSDFLGVNYYFSDRYEGTRTTHSNGPVNDMGWEMQPENLQHILKRLGRKKKPIIITETGVADKNDAYRKAWLTATIRAAHAALEDGVDVRGYLHWSFIDNFEWAYGRWPCFGLIGVDYGHNLKRYARPSALYYGTFVKKMRGL